MSSPSQLISHSLCRSYNFRGVDPTRNYGILKSTITPALTKNHLGGLYAETWRLKNDRNNEEDDQFTKGHIVGFYSLLKATEFIAFHRLTSEQVWYWHSGSNALVSSIWQRPFLSRYHDNKSTIRLIRINILSH